MEFQSKNAEGGSVRDGFKSYDLGGGARKEPVETFDDAAVNVGTSERIVNLRGDPWRFAVGVIFVIISVSNAMQWITFSAIVEEVRSFFNMTAVQVNFLATTYVIAYVAVVFLSCKLYEITGIKAGIVVAALANTFGAGLKIIALYVWPNMILLNIAQVFNSITEILTIATPPLIANRWFPESERMVANTVLSSALNFGCGLGVLLPTFFVSPEKQEQHHFGNLFWFQFSLCGGSLLLAIFFIPKRPRYMASYAAARQEGADEKRRQTLRDFLQRRGNNEDRNLQEERQEEMEGREGAVLSNEQESVGREVQPINVFSTIMDVLRMLRSNPSFGFLMISSAAELGLIWAVATVLPQCLIPFGVTEVESGWIGFLNLVLGTIVAPIVMPIILRKRQYKTVLLCIATILTINMSALTLCLAFGPAVHDNRTYYVVVTFFFWGGVAGLCQNFMMPLMFEFVIELTFPMSESTSAPVLTWSACLANLILAVVFGEVLGNDPTQGDSLRVFVGASIVCFIGGISVLLVYPYRRRYDYEELMKKRNPTEILPHSQSEYNHDRRQSE